MKLLFDENLAAVLADELADLYPGSTHVCAIGLGGAPDRTIWNHAAAKGCVLVTKDGDFHRLSVLLGSPPKVIWIRLGNSPTSEIAKLLRIWVDKIRQFNQQEEATFLELG